MPDLGHFRLFMQMILVTRNFSSSQYTSHTHTSHSHLPQTFTTTPWLMDVTKGKTDGQLTRVLFNMYEQEIKEESGLRSAASMGSHDKH